MVGQDGRRYKDTDHDNKEFNLRRLTLILKETILKTTKDNNLHKQKYPIPPSFSLSVPSGVETLQRTGSS